MTFHATASTHLQHGPISCLSCFPAGSLVGCTIKRAAWRIDNNPGYWGAAAPEVLVLGFSKGANQRAAQEFDRIAFANARENLAEVLHALGLLDAANDIDLCFTSNGTKLGFASVIRCGLGFETKPNKFVTSRVVVKKAIAPRSEVRDLFDRCTDRFLRVLPPSVRTVVFLGLDRAYVEVLYQRILELHSNVRRIGALAYATEEVTFVHVIHPSPLATSHRQKWLRDDNGSLADKRRQVTRALGGTNYDPTTGFKASRVEARNAAIPIRATRAAAGEVAQKQDDVVRMVRDAIRSSALKAGEVPNARAGKEDVDKLLRVRRHDGEEFAIDRQSDSLLIWSSVPPTVPAELRGEYLPDKTRSSNLNVMKKLRGPDKNGHFGTHAWRLRFRTASELMSFVSGV